MKNLDYRTVLFAGKLSMYDSSLCKIEVCKNDNIVCVETIIELYYPCKMYLKLIFEDITKYSFYWDKEYNFYTIESYKLLLCKDGSYYCSLDPFDVEESIHEDDKDIIMSKNIKAYCSSKIGFENSEKVILEYQE